MGTQVLANDPHKRRKEMSGAFPYLPCYLSPGRPTYLPTFPWQHLVCGYLHLVPETFILKPLLSLYLQSTACLFVSSPLTGCQFLCVHLTSTNQQVTRVSCGNSSLGCAALPPGAAVSLLHLQLWFNSLVNLYCQDYLEPKSQPNRSQKSSNSTTSVIPIFVKSQTQTLWPVCNHPG